MLSIVNFEKTNFGLMKQFEIYVDEDIVLRLYQEKTTHLLFSLVDENRTHFRKWLPWLDFNTKIEDTEKFISDSQKNYKKGTALNLGIFYKENLVGGIGFNSINKLHKSAEIGYMLGAKFNGKGIMTKSCKSLLNYGFDSLNLNRIAIKASSDNKKSRAIPERLGFKQEGILRQAEYLYGTFHDVTIYSMLKQNWLKK